MDSSIYPIYSLPFYERLKGVLQTVGLKRYSCKKSKKLFSQHALFFMLVLKE